MMRRVKPPWLTWSSSPTRASLTVVFQPLTTTPCQPSAKVTHSPTSYTGWLLIFTSQIVPANSGRNHLNPTMVEQSPTGLNPVASLLCYIGSKAFGYLKNHTHV